ncbi:MAG: lipid-A-disaccharide synthase N-terminal domain-containing protein [Cyclobacteriaceae bacterium]|nr:lipid-A-disaccharide synthase N-terminal domain-containing protein [Cyclobacteriaceae bacterium]
MSTRYDFVALIIGFAAQLFFGLRILFQWIASEREKIVVSPLSFWIFSLAGSSLFLLYGLLKNDWVIIGGQSISFYIYVKNLQLKNQHQRIALGFQILVIAFPAMIITAFFVNGGKLNSSFLDNPGALLAIGFLGQFLMSARFFYQVYYAVEKGQALLPGGFWVMSLGGSLLLLVYAYVRADLVLLTAQLLSVLPYSRNLYFIIKRKN